ncbi:TolC family protein, partial [bacterium]|nr:TolC family protein [bacterium]
MGGARALLLLPLLAAGPSLARTVADAASNHPSALAALASGAAAEAEVDAARRAWWPSLMLQSRYTRQESLEGKNKAVIDFGGGPVEVDLGLGQITGSWDAIISQPVWDFGQTRAAVALAQAGLDLARLDATAAANAAGLAAGEAWLDLWLAATGVEVAAARAKTAEEVAADAVLREAAGLATTLDTLRFAADALGAKERATLAGATLVGARARFVAATGLPAPNGLPDPPPPPQDALAMRVKDRVAVRRAAARARQAERTVASVRSRPRVDFTATARHPVNESGFAVGETATFTAVLLWPLWQPVTLSRLDAASARSEAARLAAANALALERAVLAGSKAQIEAFGSRHETALARLLLANSAARLSQAGLDAGTVTFLEWRTAEDDLV